MRMPERLRSLYREIAASNDECIRKELQSRANALRTSIWKAGAESIVKSRLSKGGVVRKSKKLFPIRAIVQQDGMQVHGSDWPSLSALCLPTRGV